jgi:hypothetical protein
MVKGGILEPLTANRSPGFVTPSHFNPNSEIENWFQVI